ncbi:hypothetical protein BJ508DRAFT_314355 [Ascobolus immersus RN42]|uniref:Uncharacterized protein n=1 Tax=Ascobolus immersus RN42 TaxID=1160509 RepID=A0A3N4HHA8_ASCIM|nr:hypothetical protein BJ508DRAFT_314355 [Ascobolus immersus RN42]
MWRVSTVKGNFPCKNWSNSLSTALVRTEGGRGPAKDLNCDGPEATVGNVSSNQWNLDLQGCVVSEIGEFAAVVENIFVSPFLGSILPVETAESVCQYVKVFWNITDLETILVEKEASSHKTLILAYEFARFHSDGVQKILDTLVIDVNDYFMDHTGDNVLRAVSEPAGSADFELDKGVKRYGVNITEILR